MESLPLITYNVRDVKGLSGKREDKAVVLTCFIKAKASLSYLYKFKYHVMKKVHLIPNEVITDDGSKSHKTLYDIEMFNRGRKGGLC